MYTSSSPDQTQEITIPSSSHPDPKRDRSIMRDLWLKMVHTSGAKIYNLIVGIITLSITARLLGPEGRGVFAAVTTWVGLFATFGSLSLGQVAIHRATEKRGSNWLAPTLGSLLFLAGIITLIGWLVAVGMFWFSQGAFFNDLSSQYLWLGFAALPFIIWQTYAQSLFMAVDRIKISNHANIVGGTISVIAIFVLLWFNWGVVGVFIATLITQIVIATFGMRYLFEQAGHAVYPDKDTIGALLQGGLKLHLNAIGTVLFTSIDIIVINHYLGATETGYYQLAVRLMSMMQIIPSSASMVIYGKVTQLGPDGAWPYQRRLLLGLTLAMTGLAALAALLAPWGIRLVAGPDFAPSVAMFQLLLFALIGQTFSALMASQWIGRGMFWQASAISLMVGIANLIGDIMLVPIYGVYGSIWSTLGVYALSVLTNGGMALWCEVQHRRMLEIRG